MNSRRAISPILAVILLMTIAILGGGILYGIQTQVLVVGLSSLDFRITDLSFQKDEQGACYFHMTLYNSGTETINNIYLETVRDDGENFNKTLTSFGDDLVPKNTAEYFEFFNSTSIECKNFTVSNTYPIFVNASSFESNFGFIKAVKVENVNQT